MAVNSIIPPSLQLITNGSSTLFALYPNPASSIVNITLPVSTRASVITVYDMQSRIAIRQALSGNNTVQQPDVSRLSAGMYQVVWTDYNQQQKWKLIKE